MKNKLPVSGRYWKRRLKSSMGTNIVRPFVEIITNSIDSYRRMERDKEGKIIIKYNHNEDSYIQDFAEGISRNKFNKIISYGEKTSGVEDGRNVRGFFGIGLKDACLALKDSKISSVKDNKRNTCCIGLNEEGIPEYEFIEENKDTYEENGTKIMFKVPDSFTELDKRKSIYHLSNNYMLRRINKNTKYKIFLIESEDILEKDIIKNRISYDDPPIEEELLNKEVKINYEEIGEIKVKIRINKSSKDLSQHGDSREGGLIIFFNEVAVLDCTLAGYDNHTYARNFFGEVELEGFEKFLEKDEPVLSDERKGLDRTHPFVNELFKILNKEIGTLVKEEERKSQHQEIKKISSLNINHALGIINKITQEEIGNSEITTPPKEFLPEQFGFYFPYEDIFSQENKSIILKINKEKVKEQIELESTNEDIEISPGIINITKNRGDYQMEKISILSSKPNIQGDIIAKTSKFNTKILINVLPNPKIKEDESFYFYPDNSNLIKGKKKEFSIICGKDILEYIDINFSSNSEKIEYPKKIKIEKDKIRKLNELLYEIKIPVICNSLEKNIKLTAEYKNFKAELIIEEVVESTPHDPKGFFKDIKYDRNRDPMELTSYEKGTIYIHTSNPILSFFQEVVTGRKDYESFFHWRCIIAKIAVERICREVILEKDKRNNLPILNLDDVARKDFIEFSIKQFYFKYGKKFIDALLKRDMEMTYLEEQN